MIESKVLETMPYSSGMAKSLKHMDTRDITAHGFQVSVAAGGRCLKHHTFDLHSLKMIASLDELMHINGISAQAIELN